MRGVRGRARSRVHAAVVVVVERLDRLEDAPRGRVAQQVGAARADVEVAAVGGPALLVLPLFLVWSAFYGVIADIWSGEDWVKSLVLDSAGLLSAISLLVATGEKFMHADVDDDERRCAPRRGAPARARASATRALV